ncbi:MAG TPA: TonB family protein [Cyclobacteriaceae bacterium]|nr:TonB family protein [Cyclobacteriaceae bacterium]
MSKNIRWDDLVFDGRNKDYGAYDLRKAYGGRVIAAFIVALIALGLVMAFPTIKKFFEEKEVIEKPKKVIDYTKLEAPPPIDAAKPPPPKLELPPPTVEKIKFLPPKITEQEVDEEVPTIEDLKIVEPSVETTDGDAEVVFDEVVAEAVQEEVEDPNMIYTVVEQAAEFPGGVGAMMKFLSQNIKYPPQARRMGIEGSVFVEFVVNATGTIQDAKVIKGIGGGCDEEALRVIGKMPVWKPGKQNGRPVRVRFVLPVKFVLG